MNQKYYNYNDLAQMQEKAKKIDYESDKKTFLKAMNPLEQKMALFFSRRPYAIINYLDSLNNNETNIMLNELTNEEISKLLEQFTSEDKNNFYSTFSNSNLVNKFIANDKQAFTHVDELDLERKIELLDSSKVATKKATEEIYNSLSSKEKVAVEEKITSTEGSLVVDNVIESSEDNLENVVVEEQELQETKNDEQELQEIKNEEPEEKPEEQEEVQKEQSKEINNFLKNRLEQYKKQNPKFKDIDITDPNIFSLLSDELKEIVTNDFNSLTEEQKNKLNREEDLLNEFQKSKEDCESEIINNAKKVELESKEEVVNDFVKTL